MCPFLTVAILSPLSMNAIENWFKNSLDYDEGVAVYASLPVKNIRILQQLNRGKNSGNMATLVYELRKLKNTAPPPTITIKKAVIEIKPKPPTQETINIEVARRQQSNESADLEYKGIMLGDLPAELRVRYSKARNIFVEMIELKFALNDLPAKAEESALKIMQQIEKYDEERDLIWEELNHWKIHKTLLPSKTDDFSVLSPIQRFKKHANTKSSISKINSRVDLLYQQLDIETDKHQQHLIESKINRSEKLLHQHKINIQQIESLL
jgi:hypothetical protein